MSPERGQPDRTGWAAIRPSSSSSSPPTPSSSAIALMLEPARRRIGLEHRALCFLDLQEKRVALVPSQQQDDPGAGAHAAHPDHLEGGVGKTVAVEEGGAGEGERV